jgi:hypothetical protein
MSDTPRTDAAVVSAEYILSEMDYYKHKFVIADHMRDLERELTAQKEQFRCVRWQLLLCRQMGIPYLTSCFVCAGNSSSSINSKWTRMCTSSCASKTT